MFDNYNEFSSNVAHHSFYPMVDGLSRRPHIVAPNQSNLPTEPQLVQEVEIPDQLVMPAQAQPETMPMQGKRNFKNFKILAAMTGLLAGMYFDPTLLQQPHIIAGLYSLFVIVLGIDSQKTFVLALAFLAATPAMLLLHREAVAEQFATLMYLLLVVGVITAIWEANKPLAALSFTRH